MAESRHHKEVMKVRRQLCSLPLWKSSGAGGDQLWMDGPQKVRPDILSVTDSSDLLTEEMKQQDQLQGLRCFLLACTSHQPVFPAQGCVPQWPTFPASACVPFHEALPAPSLVCAPSHACSRQYA